MLRADVELVAETPDTMSTPRMEPQADPAFALADPLGPEKVIHLYDPDRALRAILVVDNTACGPTIGGARMAPDVSLLECFRLARAMTLKNAAAGLPHGGGKSVIFADPRAPPAEKERRVRAFARAIRHIEDYIVGPDMGTDETCMAWCRDEMGRAVGLPPEIGGIPLDELGATGFGLAVCAEVAQELGAVTLAGARVVIEGFGSVGRHAARFLAERGARIVAVADSRGALVDPDGLDVTALAAHKSEGRAVGEFRPGTPAPGDALLDVECEVFVPAARPDVIRADNVGRLRARLVLCGANIPVTEEAERTLHQQGVVVVPDFIANAGGVICAAVEYQGGTPEQAFATIEAKLRANTRAVLETARAAGEPPRAAAVRLAESRVRRAMALRR